MIKSARRLVYVNLMGATLAVMVGTSDCYAGAGISTDGSLGALQTVAGANAGAGNFLIPQSLGALVGNNLFHSFSTFNIDTGQSATFATATPSIGNVISRVTGGSVSQINGQLRLTSAGGAPNFFFINPAGVAFGAGGSIDMPGAFHVSTADYVKFVNGDKFYADLSRTSALSSAAPEAFGFLGTSRAAITVKDGAILATKSFHPISIAGGDIELNNGTVATQGGDIRVVTLGQKEQEIGFTGALPMVEGNLAILNRSKIASSTASSGNAGTVKISAGAIAMDGQGKGAVIASFTVGNAANDAKTGDAGSIDITASGAISIVDGGQIYSSTDSSGKVGTVLIRANSLTVDGQGGQPTGIASQAVSNAANGGEAGDAGSLDITASGALSIVNGALISSITESTGNGGAVKVSAGSLAIDGQGKVTGIVGQALGDAVNHGKTGDAGRLDIMVHGALSIVNSGQITSNTFSSGKAGAVKISADSVAIDGGQGINWTGIGSNAVSNAANAGKTGDAGSLDITVSGALSIVNGSEISSSTYSFGNAGAVKVSAGSIVVDGQGSEWFTGIHNQAISDAANGGKTGDAGSLDITVSGALSIFNGGTVSSSTYSFGNAGNVKVSAGSIAIDGQGNGAGISSNANGNADNGGKTGDAGSIDIMTNGALSIVNGGQISSSTFSVGEAGTVKVSAGSITIDRQGGERTTGIVSNAVGDTANGGKAGDAG
ncbi:MAG TPA: filamentous hemagglutinin N-terminal domain-containing protein, partial [Rhodoferax sp.]|nr:filamentous hemagglutinin N-terminal domain-containing protein [Rhodoferax sp.]